MSKDYERLFELETECLEFSSYPNMKNPVQK